MLRFTLRNLAARKVRLLLSTLAVVLGVGFLAGVLVFSHGLSATFDNILKGSTPAVRVQPRGTDNFAGTAMTTTVLGPADIARLAALPEVARADGSVGGTGLYLLDRHGKVVGTTGAPTLAFNHNDSPNMSGAPMMELRSGLWPRGPGEVVLDRSAAERAGYRLGDAVSLIAPSGRLRQSFRLVGLADFNGGGTAGAILVVLDTRQAQQLFMGGRDLYNAVDLSAAPGVSQEQLALAAQRVVPAGFVAVTGDKIVKDSQDQVDAALGVISTFLLVFAIIAVVVGGFIIVNTFSILVAQRSRELALLRALGASRRQVTLSVLLEAGMMGLVASTAGVIVGWALARGLAAVFRAVGLDVAGDVLVLTRGTVVAGYLVGVLVTMGAAYLPARRASLVAPVAAMQADQPPRPGSTRRRGVAGAIVLAIGIAVAVTGLLHPPGNDAAWVGAGAGLCLLTVAALSSVAGRPVLLACRSLFGRIFGATGRLAGENALRDPRRTGATASALMIGLALVSLIGVLAGSLNRSVTDVVNDQFSADFIVEGAALMPFPTRVGDLLQKVPGVGAVAREEVTTARLDGDYVPVIGVDRELLRIYHFDVVSGRTSLTGAETFVSEDLARRHHWRVGSTVTLGFPGGTAIHPVVAGIVRSNRAVGPINVPIDLLTAAGVKRQDSALSITLAPGADATAVHRALDAVVAPLPIVTVLDKGEFADSIRAQVNQLLYLIYGLLALAIVIAMIGIVNTLGLSVIERTHELGLLRAIGLTRRQLRGMVTLESVAIAVLGAVLGTVLGVAFGVMLRQALSNDLTSLGVPFGQLGAFLVLAVVVGVLAAVAPAVRASRLNVLAAIAAE